MLAGCSSLLSSPRHRLRSEPSATQFQACHFQMSTKRLDLPCTFPRKDASRPQQPLRPPVGLSVEHHYHHHTTESKPNKHTRSLKQTIKPIPHPPVLKASRGQKRRSLDEPCINRAKRNRGSGNLENSDDSFTGGDSLSLSSLGDNNFWLQSLGSHQIPFSLSPSIGEAEEEDEEEEERGKLCFFPGLPFSNNPWDSVVTQITELEEKDHETTSEAPEASGSSDSSESRHSLTQGSLNGNTFLEPGNGSGGLQPQGDSGVGQYNGDDDNGSGEAEGFELISSLLACVEAISSSNIADLGHIISKLGSLASPRDLTAMGRVAAYFAEALAIRAARLWPHVFHIAPPRDELDRDDDSSGGTALRLLNQVSPVPKFLHFTSNEILLRAFEGKDRIHIIDFDIKQGLQWPSLFQSLAARSGAPPTHVRITGIGDSKQELNETGDRLAGFAASLSLPFEFHPVVDRLEDVRLWMLHVKDKETVAVNCVCQLHKLLYDDGGALRDLLGLIRSTNPGIVVVAEQEAEHNGGSLEARVGNSLRYYAAAFDMVGSSLPLGNSPVRAKIEQMLGREIRNIVACEEIGRAHV